MTHDPTALRQFYEISQEDLERVRKAGAGVDAGKMVGDFYVWLETNQPEFREFFGRPERLERVKRSQVVYWKRFLEARVDEEYIESRITVGKVHARIELGIHTYLSAMAYIQRWMTHHLESVDLGDLLARDAMEAVVKLLQLDSAVVIDTISNEYAAVIAEQSRSIVELSTPTIRVWDGIVLLPLIGVLDSERANQVIEGLLNAIVANEAKVAILDVTGVPLIDSYVAQHLLKSVAAARMLGAQVILTGFSPESAQTVTRLGIDLSEVQIGGSLQVGLSKAFRLTGRAVCRYDKAVERAARKEFEES